MSCEPQSVLHTDAATYLLSFTSKYFKTLSFAGVRPDTSKEIESDVRSGHPADKETCFASFKSKDALVRLAKPGPGHLYNRQTLEYTYRRKCNQTSEHIWNLWLYLGAQQTELKYFDVRQQVGGGVCMQDR